MSVGCLILPHSQLHWAVMPWLSLLAHTSGEVGFTFSLLFILLILLSPEPARAAVMLSKHNGMQGKKHMWYGTDVHKYNLTFSCEGLTRGLTAGSFCGKHLPVIWYLLLILPSEWIHLSRRDKIRAYRPGEQNVQPCSPFRSQLLKSISLHSRVQSSPLPLPEGIHTGKFPLRQKGRRRSPLDTPPLPSEDRWGLILFPGCGGWGADPGTGGWQTPICLYSPYPPFTTVLNLDSQEFLLLYLLRDWPALWEKCLCGP